MQQVYSIEEIYQGVFDKASYLASSRILFGAVFIGLAIFLCLAALMWYLKVRSITVASIVVLFLSVGGFLLVKGDLPARSEQVGNDLANVAINSGVNDARLAQATELQYILAPVIKYGSDTLKCNFTANRDVTFEHGPDDDCLKATKWYTYERTNQWTERVEHCSTDDKGKKSCYYTYVDHWDDEYTPLFAYVVRYWIEPDTKMSYLHSNIYQMKDDGGKPIVYLHPDWRAPQNPKENTYNGRRFDANWQFTNRIPEYWTRVQQHATSGGPIVLATFVGPYFNWGFASDSTQFQTYTGPYRALQKLVSLPGPNGAQLNYINAYRTNGNIQTLLSSADGDLPLDYNPVATIGVNVNPSILDEITKRAVEAQGHLGPVKQASVRWFIVSKTLTDALGGINEITTAIKAYMSDSEVWGLFALPKNQIILVTEVTDDGSTIIGRSMETGMPFGNVLVEGRVRMSASTSNAIALNADNMVGVFTDGYKQGDGTLSYVFSDMGKAGGVLQYLYEQSPDWQAPDPDSKECKETPDTHLGFIRYRMCTQEYRKSTITIKKDGYDLILSQATDEALNRTPIVVPIIVFVLAILAAAGLSYAAIQES